MADVTPGTLPLTAQAPGGRPIRKDEIELHDRGIYIESWLPERRSRRRPLLFVHGELAGSWVWERYLGYFASRGWEGHAVNLRNHYWSLTADPATLTFDSYTGDVVAAIERLGDGVVVVGHGMGGLLALKASEKQAIGGLVLSSPEQPRALRVPARQHELREVSEAYGKDRIGWETLSERVQRDQSDLTLDDVRKIQHLLGQKHHESGAALRQMLMGVAVDRGAFEGVPALVIGGGLDRLVPEPGSERLADWLGATYEPFGAHSHFGLVAGEHSHVQVADAIRTFLEANRL
jgi:non-heme chloroperoxidase